MDAYDIEVADLSKYEVFLLRAQVDDGPEANTALAMLRRKLRNDRIDVHNLRLYDRTETPFEASNRSSEFREMHLNTRIAALQSEVQSLQNQLEAARKASSTVKTVEAPKVVPFVSREPRRTAREAFDWSQFPEVELNLARRFLSGESISKLVIDARDLTGADISANQLTQRFFNGYPPQAMRVTDIHLGAPLTWEELWTIGRTVYGKSWIAKSFIGMGNLDPRKQGSDLSDIPMEAVDTLRRKAMAKISDTILTTDKIVSLALEAGSRGVTRADLRKAGCETRLLSHAIASGDVFIINPEAEVRDQRIAHRTFRD